jgi:hypothetical protein
MAVIPQGFKANPGLELANAFSIKFKLHQYESTLLLEIGQTLIYSHLDVPLWQP